mgnify:FL=1
MLTHRVQRRSLAVLNMSTMDTVVGTITTNLSVTPSVVLCCTVVERATLLSVCSTLHYYYTITTTTLLHYTTLLLTSPSPLATLLSILNIREME